MNRPEWPNRIRNDKGSERGFAPRGESAPISALVDRRSVLLGAAGLLSASGAILQGCAQTSAVSRPSSSSPLPSSSSSSLGFEEIRLEAAANDRLPAHYRRQVLLRWGDALFADSPAFNPLAQTPAAAARQFGYNNDYTAWIPFPFGSGASDRGLLVVNHEYPLPHLMFAGLTVDSAATNVTREQVDISMAAVGMTVVEVQRVSGHWRVMIDSRFNRRITAMTRIRISGPAAGHPKLRTSADPEGRWVLGTHDNCNGGVTPWGTVLSGEEGSADFFGGRIAGHPDEAMFKRYYYDETSLTGKFGWPRFHQRFQIEREPNEANRFEWVVEVDPFDPEAPPVKRTALGRFAHEGAHCALAADGRVVVYMGDDWEFEYCYKFVSRDRVDFRNRSANRDLLDTGTLYVARFDASGVLDWLPLVYGQGPLTEQNGFSSQADVLINTRRAADLLGATPMDSPEGYEPNPVTGKVYIALTGGTPREAGQQNAANPRVGNRHGHLIELTPPTFGDKPDHGALRFEWSLFVLCGDPADPAAQARFHPATTREGWFVEPDNIAFDPQGRLWVCSDGPGPKLHDGLWAMDTEGPGRALPRLFYSPPHGAECCSPAFTPDGRTLFLSVQHPGERSASLREVATRWPDFSADMPPRPSVIVITREDSGPIGD